MGDLAQAVSSPDSYARISFAQIRRETGLTRHSATKLLTRFGWVADKKGTPPTYDARILDLINAMRGLPHRSLEPAHRDWLTRYQQEHQ